MFKIIVGCELVDRDLGGYGFFQVGSLSVDPSVESVRFFFVDEIPVGKFDYPFGETGEAVFRQKPLGDRGEGGVSHLFTEKAPDFFKVYLSFSLGVLVAV